MRAADLLPRLPYMLFDPRGRVDRKGLLLLALALLALQIAFGALLMAGWIGLEHPLTISIKIAFVWVAIVAASKRLHDLGRSAWWIAGAILFLIVWGVACVMALLPVYGQTLLMPGTTGYNAVMIGNVLPAFLATLWMHFAKGCLGDNRYGPAPDATGFSLPATSGPAETTAAGGSGSPVTA